MFRLFSIFGKSAAMVALDEALRAYGVHPLLVPEAVKLTLLKMHRRVPEAPVAESAALLGYCLLGAEAFAETCGAREAGQVEARVEAAIAAGDSLDAKVILLALHAGLVAPDIAERFEIEEG